MVQAFLNHRSLSEGDSEGGLHIHIFAHSKGFLLAHIAIHKTGFLKEHLKHTL